VSRPDRGLAESHGVEARFFLVSVSSATLAQIDDLIETGRLRTRVGAVIPPADAREAHLMLEHIRALPKGKIVLNAGEP
jgi:NADPH:quinone reductase-like Zn-dependent oxidoreductase